MYTIILCSLLVSFSSGSLSPYHVSQHQTPSCIKSVCFCEDDYNGFYDLYLDEGLMKDGHISIINCPLLFLFLQNDENFISPTIEILNSGTIQLAQGNIQQKIKFKLESLENFIVKGMNFADQVTISAKKCDGNIDLEFSIHPLSSSWPECAELTETVCIQQQVQ